VYNFEIKIAHRISSPLYAYTLLSLKDAGFIIVGKDFVIDDQLLPLSNCRCWHYILQHTSKRAMILFLLTHDCTGFTVIEEFEDA
jgi:hypothetical protein